MRQGLKKSWSMLTRYTVPCRLGIPITADVIGGRTYITCRSRQLGPLWGITIIVIETDRKRDTNYSGPALQGVQSLG